MYDFTVFYIKTDMGTEEKHYFRRIFDCRNALLNPEFHFHNSLMQEFQSSFPTNLDDSSL